MLSHTSGLTWDIRLLNMSRSIGFCGLKFSGIGFQPKERPLFTWTNHSATYVLWGQKQGKNCTQLSLTPPKVNPAPPQQKNTTKQNPNPTLVLVLQSFFFKSLQFFHLPQCSQARWTTEISAIEEHIYNPVLKKGWILTELWMIESWLLPMHNRSI